MNHRRTPPPGKPTRRAACAAFAAGVLGAPLSARAEVGRATDGAALYADVAAYEALGDTHRTATPADAAGAAWLSRRLAASGFETALRPFPVSLFEPDACRVVLSEGALDAFPAWPVKPTPAQGLSGVLSTDETGPLAGRIALLRLAYTGGGAWAAPGYGERVMGAIGRGATGVVAITEGPSGEVIALNAAPARFDWPVPVVLAGGRDGARLMEAAASGQPVTLLSTGRATATTAANVVARRRGRDRTVIVSTPRSGWFGCAGERGSGIAIFLALAQTLARATDADLLFIAASGHELGEAGQRHFLKTQAPAPETVGLWLHIGANVAVQEVAFTDGRATPLGRAIAKRGITLSADLADAAAHAFAGTPGYAEPKVFGPGPALGELEPIRQAGYQRLAGLLGFNPLFHTRLDRTPLAVAPAILAPVAQGAAAFVRAAI